MTNEYLYIMDNVDWQNEKYKYGFTTNPHKRICSEQHSYKSQYVCIWKIVKSKDYYLWKESDKIISIGCRNGSWLPQFQKHLVNHNGGMEFIYSSGLDLLFEIFDDLSEFNITTERLSIYQIEKINSYSVPNPIMPRDYQFKVLHKLAEFYKQNNKAKLIWACGLGKTIMSLLIAERMNFYNVFIGVPLEYCIQVNHYNLLSEFDYL